MGDKWRFRGFDAIGRKGWVYGDLVHVKRVTVTGLEDRVKVGGYEVVPESVGICVGFNDKNNVMIYEGDVIREESGVLGYVRYDVVMSRFEYGQVNKYGTGSCWSWLDASVSEYEVVGNIYEHPDMVRILKE